ncbi:MAG: zinc ABC transporter substrate-binding protein [Tepidimonas sp.]|uniref:metal ABC transporter solute-binding protein, Zn/Mn family n=1 Tax=Tepidimonas sp. TaxID=2002775 RepID=UPI00259F876D|nr:zinc ABC transporter substrate-binding protein [Tepidimonas sp.]MDM7456686.1 zinc ABC transporter substrate-binding protein [Tepidimonas sp.]
MNIFRHSSCSPLRRRLLLGGLAASAMPRLAAAQAVEPLRVVVSILPQKQFVERVAGNAAQVEVLVRPGQSPATYDPTPAQLVELGNAQVYFRIGVPFEANWVPRFQSQFPKLRIVDTRQGIELAPMRGADGQPAASGARDPHIWTSPRLVKRQAQTIRDALIELAPAQREAFEAGYTSYAAELDALDAELRQTLAGKTQRRFMVFHPAWGYLARDYGLEMIPIEVEGKEPSPKALTALIEQARSLGVRVIFVQRQFSRTAAESGARAIGGEVVELNPLEEDFIGQARRAAAAIARGMV